MNFERWCWYLTRAIASGLLKRSTDPRLANVFVRMRHTAWFASPESATSDARRARLVHSHRPRSSQGTQPLPRALSDGEHRREGIVHPLRARDTVGDALRARARARHARRDLAPKLGHQAAIVATVVFRQHPRVEFKLKRSETAVGGKIR